MVAFTGTVKTRAGTSGTETFSSGAKILMIVAIGGSGATLAIPNGQGGVATVPLPSSSPWMLEEHHAQRVLQGTGAQLQLVFASTVSYLVEYVDPSGVA